MSSKSKKSKKGTAKKEWKYVDAAFFDRWPDLTLRENPFFGA